MASEFLIWRKHYAEGKCVVTAPDPLEDGYELDIGISRLKNWPRSVTCRMSDEFPKDIELTDNLFGTALVIVSAPLKRALAQEKDNEVEFLPVQIVNHKGKVASKDYFIVNPIGLVDCVDVAASGIEWNRFSKEQMRKCKSLVIDAERVPAKVTMFRTKTAPFAVVVRDSLARKLKQQRFADLEFKSALDYTGP